MKRFLGLLLGLCLWTVSACAENVREQVDAPESIQADYYTNTGKSLVAVDAQVYVPDVEEIFLYPVQPRRFEAQELWALAECVLPDVTWHLNEAYQMLEPGELKHSENAEAGYTEDNLELHADAVLLEDGDPSIGMAYLFNTDNQTAFGTQPGERSLRFEAADSYNHPYFYTSTDFVDADSVGKDIPAQTTTFAQAQGIAEALVAQLEPSFTVQLGGAVSGEICYHKAGTKRYRNVPYPTPAYLFAFSRVIDGVTITFENSTLELSKMRDMPMAPAPNTERFSVVVHNGRIVNVQYDHPYAIGEALPEACKLLPFEKIMEVFAAIAPLSIQNMENENAVMGGSSNQLKVKEIRLGYMPVLKKDDPNQWVLRPVWDFMGARKFARENYDWPCTSWLTIDAIDGTVIDRAYGY